MRVLLSGGGTGGHINPAIAIGDKIKQECPDSVIEYVGTRKGLETKLVPAAGYKLHFVKVRGLKRSLSPENLKAAIEAVTSVYEAKKIIKSFKPDIVIGTGGYVCWPVLKAAAKMKIPTIVHESNALPGIATKMLAKHVDKILVNFKESCDLINASQEKILRVGNPVKSVMFSLDKQQCRKEQGIAPEVKMLLSYGGSLGARVMNENIFEAISQGLIPKDVYHVHATGNGYWEKAKEKFLGEGFELCDEETMKKANTVIKKYIYNMPQLMASCDLVICRAGAMTVSEVAAMKKAAIFVPSPNVADNHQFKNANVLKMAGAAVLIEEKDLTPQSIACAIESMLNDKQMTEQLSSKVGAFATTDCLDRIYTEVCKLVRG